MEEQVINKPKNVFHNKNFVLVFLGALVSNIASLFYSFAVSFYILKISENNALIQGIYLASGGAVFCIVTLFGGVISDRFNKAKIMYFCDFIKGGMILLFTFLLMTAIKTTTMQIVGLFCVNIISNAIAGIFSPASTALLPLIVEQESYQQAESYFSILNSFQSIIGVILAGVLYTLVPINVLFLIVGICYIGSAISEMFIKYNTEYEKRDEKMTLKIIFTDIGEGFRYLFSIKAILALMICILFINFFFTPIFDNFSPYFIATDITESDYLFNNIFKPEMWSSFFSVAFGIGSLIMGIILSNLKQREKNNKVIRYSMLALSFLIICMAVIYCLFKQSIVNINFVLISCLIILFLLGIALVLVNVSSTTSLMLIIDKDKIGKVTSVSSIGSQGLIPIAMFLGGVAITSIGASGLLIICSAGLFLLSVILFFNKAIREI